MSQKTRVIRGHAGHDQSLRKRIRFAQNFLNKKTLASSLVSQSNICARDIVYEIGAGAGVITEALVQVASKVIAIEIDESLVKHLKNTFQANPRVCILSTDFLTYTIQEDEYKIFSNLPFNVTAEVIRKLVLSNNPPRSAYLIIQKEAAWRYCNEKDSTLFSALSYPWFYFHLMQHLDRHDFDPVPAVEPVFMAIHKRETPYIHDHDKILYKKFISFGFGVTKKNLKLTFKNVFSYNQWKRLSKDLGFSLHASARELNNQQWLGLFRYFKTGVAKDKAALIEGYPMIK